MQREDAYLLTLDAIAKIQRNVSLIVGAKAIEAEKVKNWMIEHITEGTYTTHADRLMTCLQIHEMQIEVIDGLTKMLNGLCRSMRAILNPETEESGGMMPFGANFSGEDQGG